MPPEIDLEACDPKEINQGYLDEDGKVIRYRQKGDKWYKAHKSPTDDPVVRVEHEVPITEAEYLTKWPQTEGKRIRKFRYHIPSQGYIVELDVFLGDAVGHMMAEVEFETIEEAEAFTAPSWFGKEVTADKRYGNADIAEHGFPKAG